MHTAAPLVPKPSSFEAETANEELERHKPPGTDQILTDLIQGGKMF
jgi:hypothetical protein